MGKIVAFPNGRIIDKGSHPDLVKLCTLLVKEAKKGDLQALAVACVYEDGGLYADWSVNEGEQWNQLLTAVLRLQRRMEDEECD